MTDLLEQQIDDEQLEAMLEGEEALPTELEWAGRYVRQHKAMGHAADRLNLAAEVEISRIKEWLERKLMPLEARKERLENSLRVIFENLQALSPKMPKYIDTPTGKASFREPTASLKVIDEATALDALQDAGLVDFVKLPPPPAPKVDVAGLKKAGEAPKRGDGAKPYVATQTGEVIEGLEWQIADELTVKIE